MTVHTYTADFSLPFQGAFDAFNMNKIVIDTDVDTLGTKISRESTAYP